MTKIFLVVFVALFVSQGISVSFTVALPAPKSTSTPAPAASNTVSASATTIKQITSQPTVIAVPESTTSTRLQIAVGQGLTQTIVNIKPENVIAINSLNRNLIDVSFSQKCFSRIL